MTGVAKVDPNPTAIQLIIVHVANGAESGLRILKLDEGKSPRLARILVRYHPHLDDPTQLREGLVELVLRGVEREISNENIVPLTLRAATATATTTTTCMRKNLANGGGKSRNVIRQSFIVDEQCVSAKTRRTQTHRRRRQVHSDHRAAPRLPFRPTLRKI